MVAVRVLTDKATYNQLELPSGRMSQVKKGDVLAGVLGHRQALFGYSGHLPERLAPGDRVQILNLGGVIGICDSVNPDLGPPVRVRGAGRGVALSGARRAHRRARADRSGDSARPARQGPPAARRPRRSGSGDRRHLHERRQDRGGLRPDQRDHPRRLHGRRLEGDRRLAAPRRPGDGGRGGSSHRAVHRPRRGVDDAQERRRGHPRDAHRSRRRIGRRGGQARRDRGRAR